MAQSLPIKIFFLQKNTAFTCPEVGNPLHRGANRQYAEWILVMSLQTHSVDAATSVSSWRKACGMDQDLENFYFKVGGKNSVLLHPTNTLLRQHRHTVPENDLQIVQVNARTVVNLGRGSSLPTWVPAPDLRPSSSGNSEPLSPHSHSKYVSLTS